MTAVDDLLTSVATVPIPGPAARLADRAAGELERHAAAEKAEKTTTPPVDQAEADSIIDRLRARILTSSQLADLPSPAFLVDTLLPADALTMLYGPPGTYKSFLAVDLAAHIALGRPWCGLDVTPGRVLYVVAESPAGTGGRIAAWAAYHEVDLSQLDRLHWLRDAVNIYDPLQALALASIVNERDDDLVVIDTLARCTVGAEENSAKDMGIVIAAADKLRAGGRSVLLVHHTGKDAERGGRGSSALKGAVDAELETVRETGKHRVTLKVRKQKNLIEREAITLGIVERPPSAVLVHQEKPAGGDGTFRPTTLMERVSMVLANASEPLSKNQIRKAVTGDNTTIDKAVDVLATEGYATVEPGRHGPVHRHAQAYLAHHDPLSDTYSGTFDALLGKDAAPS
jgi:hypothetical protein